MVADSVEAGKEVVDLEAADLEVVDLEAGEMAVEVMAEDSEVGVMEVVEMVEVEIDCLLIPVFNNTSN